MDGIFKRLNKQATNLTHASSAALARALAPQTGKEPAAASSSASQAPAVNLKMPEEAELNEMFEKLLVRF